MLILAVRLEVAKISYEANQILWHFSFKGLSKQKQYQKKEAWNLLSSEMDQAKNGLIL
jgi:hypothetical protein